MIKIVVDSQTREKLRSVAERVELCDEAGEVLGQFVPAEDRLLYRIVKSPTSDEELKRRMAGTGGRTLDEILADLEKQA